MALASVAISPIGKPSAATPPVVEMVEVVDGRNRPLAILPLHTVHAQQLYHRSVLVLVYNTQGKLYLQKRSKSKTLYPGRWDVSASGHVQALESVEGAARRELKEELDLASERLQPRVEVPASPMTGYEFVTVFSAGRVHGQPRPNPAELEGGMFVDSEEMAYLASEYLEVLTPGLVYLFENAFLFPTG